MDKKKNQNQEGIINLSSLNDQVLSNSPEVDLSNEIKKGGEIKKK